MKLFFENKLNEDLDEQLISLADEFWNNAKSRARAYANYSAAWFQGMGKDYKYIQQPIFYRNNNKNSITYKMVFNTCEDHHKSVERAVDKVKDELNDFLNKNPELKDWFKISKSEYGTNGHTQTYNFSLTLSSPTENKVRTEKDLQKATRAIQIKNYFDKFVRFICLVNSSDRRKKVSGGWIAQPRLYNAGNLLLEYNGMEVELENDCWILPEGWLPRLEHSLDVKFSEVSSKKVVLTPLFDVNKYENIIPRDEFQFSIFIPEPDDWSKWR